MKTFLICVLVAITGASCKLTAGGQHQSNDTGDSGNGYGTGSGEETCMPETLAPRCTPAWHGDKECDPSNNVPECNWDGGDCCASTCTGTGCGAYGYECRDPAAGGAGVPTPAVIGDPCAVVADPFAPAQLQAEVSLLASDALAGRKPSSDGDLTARKYIEERFRCLGLAPGVGSCYQQPFYSTKPGPTANVVGVIRGSDSTVADQVIVVGAHHDHLGIGDEVAGQIYNGANDNASGTVALLAIADQIKRQAVAPRRTIVFVTFGDEEEGLTGSAHFVANPPPGLSINNIVYMVNLDMLGTYNNSQNIHAYGTFAGTPGRLLVDQLLAAHPQLAVTRGIAAEEDSDYDAFCKANIPYVYFETEDDCWHEPCDDAERLDYAKLAEITGILHDVVVGLGDSTTDLVMAKQQFGCKKVSETTARRATTRGCGKAHVHANAFTADAPLNYRKRHHAPFVTPLGK